MGFEFPASIVIPLLDQVDEWLDRCLRSALAQTVRSEVVVVLSPKTGRSNRDLLGRLQTEFDNLRVIPREVLGFPGALNAGFRAASSPRTGLLLSDDWLEPRAIELCLPHDVDIVSSGNRIWDGAGQIIFEELGHAPQFQRFLAIETLERKARYLQHFFLFRTSKLQEIGGADESLGDFPGIDDFDMIWVLLERGATVAIVQQQLYNYRDHLRDRLTLRSREEAMAVLERILDKHAVIGPERAKALRDHSIWYGRPLHVVFDEMLNRLISS